MKKLAILLSVVLLISAMASMGVTTASAEGAEYSTYGEIVFDTDFSDKTIDGISLLTAATVYSYGNNSAGTRANKVVDGAWLVKETAGSNLTQWRTSFGTYNPQVPLLWNTKVAYTIEFDWSILAGYEAGAGLRLLYETDTGMGNNVRGTRAFQYFVIDETEAQNEGTSGHVAWTIDMSKTPINDMETDAAMRLVFIGKGLTSFTVDNFRISKSEIVYGTDFSSDSVAGIARLNTASTYSFSNNSAGTRVNKIVGGVWQAKEQEANTHRWRGVFGTYTPDAPLTWNEGKVYTIAFDWTAPITYTEESSLAVLFETDDNGQGSNLNGTRAYGYDVISDVVEQENITSGHVAWKIEMDTETAENIIEENAAMRVIFRAKGITDFTIDNLRILDVTPPAPAPDENAVSYKGLQKKLADEGAEYTALRFAFDLNCTGVTKDDNHRRVIADDATVTVDGTAYKLVDFGALLSTNPDDDLSIDSEDDIFGVRAYNLYDVKDGVITYTIGVANMPLAQPEKVIYVRAFVTYKTAEGEAVTIYGDAVSGCLNDVA